MLKEQVSAIGCRCPCGLLLGVFVLLLGCGESSPPAEPESAETSEKEGATRPAAGSLQKTDSSADSKPEYKTLIRLKPVDTGLWPTVIPDNGARHGFATILESLGSGCAAVDFDHDGWPDAIIGGGGDFDGRTCVGLPVSILRNCGAEFKNVTENSGIGTSRFYHHGVCAADYDGDGFDDLLVTGFDGVQLFRNQGDGTFVDVGENAQGVFTEWSASAAWGDFNRDGFLDVYVTGYVDWSFKNDPPCYAADGVTRDNCSPKIFDALPDRLFISNADGSFSDSSDAYGVRPDGKALGAVAADLNADRFLDLYVGNDVMMNFLYQNEGGKKFTDWAMLGGAGGSRRGSPDASMGVDVVDFNNDGKFDIWAANFEMESFALYQNLGNMQFRHVSDITGVSAIGGQYVGWGTAFADLDLDGDSDAVVCNGNVVQHPKHSPTLQTMVLLENIEGQYFEEVTEQAGQVLVTPQHGRGLAWTDWNRDGKPDLLTSPTHARALMLQNESNVSGIGLSVQLVGTVSPRHAIGSVVELKTTTGRQSKQLTGGGSYASTSLAEIHFGLPEGAMPEELSIKWPSGIDQTIQISAGHNRLIVVEDAHSVYWAM